MAKAKTEAKAESESALDRFRRLEVELLEAKAAAKEEAEADQFEKLEKATQALSVMNQTWAAVGLQTYSIMPNNLLPSGIGRKPSGGGSRTRRSQAEMQQAIAAAVDAIRARKADGATPEQIQEAVGFKLSPSVKVVLEKAGHKLKTTGQKRATKYFMAD